MAKDRYGYDVLDNSLGALLDHRNEVIETQIAALEAKDAEMAGLKTDKDVIRSQERNGAYERDIDALEAEIAKLTQERDDFVEQIAHAPANRRRA